MSRNVKKRAPNEDSDQPAHSRSLIRILIGRILDSQECTQQAHDVNTTSPQMTLIQRRINVDVTSWRCSDVEAMLY